LRASGEERRRTRADARHQFARSERLDHVVVGADFEQQHLVELVVHGAEDDDRRLHGGGAQLLADFRAAHAGKPQVHQHHIGLQGDRLIEAAASVAHQHGAEAFLLEHHADGVAQAFVVVNHENRLHFLVNAGGP
jgi:hypothetical protein